MKTRRHSGHSGPETRGRALRPMPGTRALCGWTLCLLLLGWGSAAPARAYVTVDGTNSSSTNPYTISGAVSGTIYVKSGGYLNIIDGAQISSTGWGVYVYDGTVNISGGTIYGTDAGLYLGGGHAHISGGSLSDSVWVNGGTADISGGTIAGSSPGLQVSGGIVTVSGGSISAYWGMYVTGGTVSVFGCGLRVPDAYHLTGTLQDGTAISLHTLGVSASNLQNASPPQINCPADVVIPAPTGACGASVLLTPPTASDSCLPSLPVVGVRSDALALTDPYPLGSTTIAWTAADGASSASCTQTVTVTGTRPPPVITLNASNPLTVECHTTFTDPGATAAGCGSVSVTPSGSVDPNTPGSYTLTYTASDSYGDVVTATRTVNVVDTMAPVITPPASITQATDAGQCSAQIALGTATATDTCAGALTPTGTRSDGQPLTAPYPLGTTTITWTAIDPSGNKATASQTVTVKDVAAPTLSGLSAKPNALWPPNHQLVDVTVNYTAADNCGGAVTCALSATSSEADSGLTPDDEPGDIQIVDAHHLKLRAERYAKQGRVYTITVTATDASGNRTQQTVTVTVPH